MPPPILMQHLRKCLAPDLKHISLLARLFDVSKEAMARAYASYHDEAVAIIVTHEGRVQRCYRNRLRFPFIFVEAGQSVPRTSLFSRERFELGAPSDKRECDPEIWIRVEGSQKYRGMTEQVYLQQNGYALIMLHLDIADEEEEAEEVDLRESWRIGFRRR